MLKTLGAVVAVSLVVVTAVLAMAQAQDKAAPVIVDRSKGYSKDVNFDSLPPAATLKLEFTPTRQGTCPTTYRATEVWLNGKLLRKIDFRPMTLGTHHAVDIEVPGKMLKVGRNRVEIAAGSCQYDIDVMRLDSVVLR
jgi:hypothetical protein